MKKALSAAIFMIAGFFISVETVPVHAQKEVSVDKEAAFCSEYYKFGSAVVELKSASDRAVSGTSFPVEAAIFNGNEYPIVSGAIYVKVFREQDDPEYAQRNGPDAVDQFFAIKGLVIPPMSTATSSFTWNVPANAPSGTYKIAPYFTVADKFNLQGLTFSDDVHGRTLDFTVVGETEGGVFFDKNTVKVDGHPYSFAAFPPQIDSIDPVTIEATLKNETSSEQVVPVTVRIYRWDGTSEDLRIGDASSQIDLSPGESKPVSFIIEQRASVVLAVIEAGYKDTKSILNVRFVHENQTYPRINFAGLTAFPLQKGATSTAFVCMHAASVGDTPSESKVIMTLSDSGGNEITSQSYEGPVTSQMMAIASDLIPKRDYETVTLTAETYQHGVKTDSAVIEYRCEDFGADFCESRGYLSLYTVTGSALLIVILAGLLVRAGKRKAAIAGTLMLFAALGFFPGEASAESVTWSISESYNGGPTNPGTPMSAPQESSSGATYNIWIQSISASVSYAGWMKNADTGDIIPSGSTLPVGTRILFENAPFKNTDISWSMAGGVYGTPYGYWTNTLPYCATSDYMTNTGEIEWYTPLGIAAKPDVSIETGGTAGLSKSGNVYTVTSPGTITADMVFGSTGGGMVAHAKGGVGNEGRCTFRGSLFDIDVPEQRISFSATAIGANNLPNTPTLVCPSGAVPAGTYGSFSISGTDPDGDAVSYNIYYGSATPGSNTPADQRVPFSGDAPSGGSEHFSKSWSEGGTKTVWGQTVDSKGGKSGWSSCQVNVTSSHYLTVSVSGVGKVSSSPAGIHNCSGTCGAAFVSGTTVDLAPSAGEGYSFARWEGACSGTGSCRLTIDSAKTVSAIFEKDAVSPASGSITASPSSLSAGGGSVRVQWSVSNASTCSASGGWSGSKSPSGSQMVRISRSTTFILTCMGEGGSWTGRAPVTVALACEDESRSYRCGSSFSGYQYAHFRSSSVNTIYQSCSISPSEHSALNIPPGTATRIDRSYYDDCPQCWLDTHAYKGTTWGCSRSLGGYEFSHFKSTDSITSYSSCNITQAGIQSLENQGFSYSHRERNPGSTPGEWIDTHYMTRCVVPDEPDPGTCNDTSANNYGDPLPCDYSSPASGDGDGGSGSGSGSDSGSGHESGFTISADSSSTQIQFLGQLGASSVPRTIEVNPSGGFSDDVTIEVVSIRSQATGMSLPSDIEVSYSFDDGVPSENPSVRHTLDSALGRYRGGAGLIGSSFVVTLSQPIQEPYSVTIRGTSGSKSAEYVITINPKPVDPSFIEI